MTLRLTPSEYRQLLEQESAKASGGAKYRNKKIRINGKSFDSVNEGAFYLMLLRSRMEGEIIRFFRQVPIDLSEETNRVYRVDFQIFTKEQVQYVDVKGFVTKGFVLKKALVESRHGITVQVVKKVPSLIPRCMWNKEIKCTTKRALDKLRVPSAIPYI